MIARDEFNCRAFVLIQSDMQEDRGGSSLATDVSGSTCADETEQTCETPPYIHWLQDATSALQQCGENWTSSSLKDQKCEVE